MGFLILQKEKDGRTIDNICGAACRMIIANIKLVPVGEVFPMVVSKLPLKVSYLSPESEEWRHFMGGGGYQFTHISLTPQCHRIDYHELPVVYSFSFFC